MDDLLTVLVNGGIVAAFLEALKRALGTHFNWTRFGALLALGVGVATALMAVGLGWYPVQVTYGQAVFSGLMAGITASGLNRGISQSAPTVTVEGQVTEGVSRGTPATAVVEEPTMASEPVSTATLRPPPPPPGDRSNNG